MSHVNIIIKPSGITVKAEEGELFRDVLIRVKLGMAFPCGGAGICGKCRVKVEKGGTEPDYTEVDTLGKDMLSQGIRLACRMKVKGDMDIEILEHAIDEKILEVGSERGVLFDPYIISEVVSINEPTLEHPVPDAERIKEKTGKKIKELSLLRKIPRVLRESNHTVEVLAYKSGEIVDIRPDEGKGLYGVGVDIGTTTVAVTLVNLKNGRHIYTASVKNPQEAYGGDVVSRIQYCTDNELRLKELSSIIRKAIDGLIKELCTKASVSRQEIYEMVVVGNTVMNHFFLGIEPKYIALSPYVPAVKHGVSVHASEMDIEINKNGMVHTAPNIAGFVGGDTVGGILDCGMLGSEKPLMLVDIGTNGEIVLGSSKGLKACSTAAGPAFEGVNLKHGMRAGQGAIERVIFDECDLTVRTIGDAPPVGICGSGIIDVIGGMVEKGIIDSSGRLKSDDEIGNDFSKKLSRNEKGETEFILVHAEDSGTGREISITQKDIREIQLAKGALAAGVQILLDKEGIKAGDVEHIFLAGAFGNYIRKSSALALGLFPGFSKEQIKFIGNAAGYGAVMMLLSGKEFMNSKKIQDMCEYIEIGTLPEFQKYFVDMMMF